MNKRLVMLIETDDILSHMCGVYCPCDKPMLYHTGLYQKLPVGTTFDTVPRFDTSMTLLSRSIDIFAFEILENIIPCEGKVDEIL